MTAHAAPTTDGENHPAPSFGTVEFVRSWCASCTMDTGFNRKTYQGGCRILTDSLVYGETKPEYPAELQHNESGIPICTAFDKIPCHLNCQPIRWPS